MANSSTRFRGESGLNDRSDGNGDLPHLIVLDVLLSGKDGRTICRKLKSQDHTKYIPVIMISGHLDAERSTRDVGADAFVAKPFSINAIMAVADQLLAGRKQG